MVDTAPLVVNHVQCWHNFAILHYSMFHKIHVEWLNIYGYSVHVYPCTHVYHCCTYTDTTYSSSILPYPPHYWIFSQSFHDGEVRVVYHCCTYTDTTYSSSILPYPPHYWIFSQSFHDGEVRVVYYCCTYMDTMYGSSILPYPRHYWICLNCLRWEWTCLYLLK